MKWVLTGIAASLTALMLTGMPNSANAASNCKMGLWGRVCNVDITSSKKHHRNGQKIKKRNRYNNKQYHPRPKPRFPKHMATNGRSTFVFDPKQLAWAAYGKDGNLVRIGPASGGQHYCRDIGRGCKTPSGRFAVYRRGGAGCKSSKYPIGKGGAKMPYCTFFHGGYAIHGSGHVPAYNASHGCVRVLPSDAKWLSKNFLFNGTRVIVLPY